MKALRTFALLSFVFLQLLWPFRAYAFIPPSLGWLGAAPFAGESTALAPLAANPVGAAVIAVGAGYLLWKANQWNNCEGIALIARAACTPPGWTRDANGNLVPTAATIAATSTTTTYQYSVCRNNWTNCQLATASTLAAVEKDVCTKQGLTWVQGIECRNPVTWDASWLQVTSGTYNVVTYSCPAGYTLSGTNCNLTAPTQAAKPAGTPCQIILNNGVFTYDPQNPACPATAPAPATVNGIQIAVSPDGKTMTLTGPGGAIAVISIGSPNIVIQQATPMTDSAGSPVTQIGTTTLSPPSTDGTTPPKVQKQQVDYQNGQGNPFPPSGTTPSQPNLTSSIDCSMISQCDWAKSSIQQQQYTLQQQQYQTQQQALQAEQQTSTNTGTIASLVQSIRDYINPPNIPDTDLSTTKPKNESIPIALDDSDKFMGGTSACPPPLQVQFVLGGQLVTIPLTYEPICLFASYMRPFFVLTAYITAAFIIFRE